MTHRYRVVKHVVRLSTASLLLLVSVFTAGPATAARNTPPIPCISPPAGPELTPMNTDVRWALSGYTVSAPSPYWSVVATRGSQGYDSDLVVYDGTNCAIGASLQGGFSPTDWVAWDNNSGRLPTGVYPLRVIGHSGNTSPVKYIVQFARGSRTLSTSSPSTNQPIGISPSNWVVDIRDVYLEAGHSYTFTVTGGLSALHILSSTTTDPTTWARTPATSTTSLTLPGNDLYVAQTGSLTVYPAQTGWYGALFVRNGWWGAATSVRVTTV